MEIITAYKAKDGKLFTTEEQCDKHETDLTIEEIIAHVCTHTIEQSEKKPLTYDYLHSNMKWLVDKIKGVIEKTDKIKK